MKSLLQSFSPSAGLSTTVVGYWQKYVHKIHVNCLEDYASTGKSVSKLIDQLDMTLTVLTGM